MGCPSNVRLYTSYYNNFIMEKFANALSISHGVNLILHGVSVYYSLSLSDKVSDSQKYTLTEIKKHVTPAVINATDNTTITPEIITYPAQPITDENSMFYMINPMNQLTIMNFIVIFIMLMHLLRTGMDGVRDALSYDGGADGARGIGGMVMQAIHIACYGISHFLAIYIVFLISGYRDLLSATLIFVSVIGLEALQHFSANPNPPDLELNPLSRAFIGFFTGVPTLVAIIMVAVAIGNRDLPNGVLGFVALLVLEGLKFAVQVIKPIRDLVGDPRVAHAYHDALIKVFAVWYLLIQSLQQDGGIDGETTELSDRTLAVGWSGFAIFVLYFGYVLLGLAGVGPGIATPSEQDKRDFPSATMEEKSRMLQVA